jgi:hypothetical protein
LERAEPDEARVFDRSSSVLDRVAIDRTTERSLAGSMWPVMALAIQTSDELT